MLMHFENLHATYLVGRSERGAWVFTPANDRDPAQGTIVHSHQIFSNNALQVSISIYNRLDKGVCVGVGHCLLLKFTHRIDNKYLLTSDPNPVVMHLDIGAVSQLYSWLCGAAETLSHRFVRPGKSPKSLFSVTSDLPGGSLGLTAEASTDGTAVRIGVALDRSAVFALSAACIGYGRLLYPSLSDGAVIVLLSAPTPKTRACADFSSERQSDEPGLTSLVRSVNSVSPEALNKLRKTIWAIGNQKWPLKNLEALKRIQTLSDPGQLQGLIDEGNKGEFSSWDMFLSE